MLLLKKGYTIKILTRTCFDIIARKEETILLIKVLEDANSISEEYAKEMNRINAYVNGSPIIIAKKAGAQLHDNVVYSRFSIYCLNLASFKSCIENKLPFVRSDHAGLLAHINGDKLKKVREEEGLSLNALAKKVGVSVRMIQKYEDENADVTLNKALRMYNFFGDRVFEKVNVFSSVKAATSEPKTDVTKKYTELGFKATETKKVPFDVIAKKEKELILTEVGDKTNPQLQSLSRLIDADNLVIFKKKKPKNIPSLTKKEFLDFEKADELIKFLKEFE
jgi:putative transcriptional regulator